MKTGHNYYVYIVQCADGLYYTGVTNDVERRIWEHNTGYNKDCFTYKRRPVTLMYNERFNDIRNAISWEKQIKGWSRKKKEALFIADWEEIRKLARSKDTAATLRHAQGDTEDQSDHVILRHPEASDQDDSEKQQ